MNQSGSSAGSRVNVPEARGALDNMKFEIARELGINFKQGYNGDSSRATTATSPAGKTAMWAVTWSSA